MRVLKLSLCILMLLVTLWGCGTKSSAPEPALPVESSSDAATNDNASSDQVSAPAEGNRIEPSVADASPSGAKGSGSESAQQQDVALAEIRYYLLSDA